MQLRSVRQLGFRVLYSRGSLWAAALMISACSSSTGTLTVTWTLASSSDTTLCTKYGVTNVAVLVKDSSGNPYTNTTPACSALVTTDSNVPTGTYSIAAQLLDANGINVSNSIGPIYVSVTSGNTTVQNVDFPTTSINTSSTTGSLTIFWTIASESADTQQCSTYGAANISVALFGSNGQQYGDKISAPCAAETTSIPNVQPGTYSLSAQMVDTAGQPVSSTFSAPNVTIKAQAATPQFVNFPATAFSNIKGPTDAGN